MALFNNGDGTFRLGPENSLSEIPYWLIAEDVVDDEQYDLVATGGTNSVWVLRNVGGGQFEQSSYRTEKLHKPTFMGSADLTGNSKADLFITSRRGNEYLAIFENKGSGELEEIRAPKIPPTRRAVAADLDGNGTTDLAGIAHETEEIWISKNLGNARFAPADPLPVGVVVQSIASAVLDGDDRPKRDLRRQTCLAESLREKNPRIKLPDLAERADVLMGRGPPANRYFLFLR